MAGDWIKIEMATPDKPEVDQMSEILGIDPDAVVGKLLRFWVWADIQSVDGHGLSVTKKLIDRVTYCEGFADALIKVGWLVASSGSFAIPRFDRHNGKSAKNRAEATERKRASRINRDKCHGNTVTEAGLEKRTEEGINKNPRGNDSPPPDFAEQAQQIVNAYPRREKIASALAIVLDQLEAGESFEAMLSGTKAAAAVIRQLPSGALNTYVPAAETFFSNKRWADDPDTLRRQGDKQTGKTPMSDDEVIRSLGGRAGNLSPTSKP